MSDGKSTVMARLRRRSLLAGLAVAPLLAAPLGMGAHAATATDALASWNDGAAKQAILDFVRATTDASSPRFVKPEDRVATFDQDGTLWVEHPVYAQAFFALDRLRDLAPQHPEWRTQEPFRTALSKDMAGLAHLTERDWAEIVFRTHAGMTQAAFQELVGQWLAAAKHPRFERPFTDLVYQPMREVIGLLQANGFKVYIVTGGGQDFVRAYAQHTYGIAPEQVIGSSIATKYGMANGKPELTRLPKLFFNDNNAGKAIGIDLFIGKRPTAAFGNSTGDREMLEWTGTGTGARLMMLVLHDDAGREYAYGPAKGLPPSHVGTFDAPLLQEADTRGWTVISMKSDWKTIFAFDKNSAG